MLQERSADASQGRHGRVGEEIAAEYLSEQGHVILQRRWRTARGEIDLITRDGEQLVAVEVKTRRGTGYGHPFEAVDPRKLGGCTGSCWSTAPRNAACTPLGGWTWSRCC